MWAEGNARNQNTSHSWLCWACCCTRHRFTRIADIVSFTNLPCAVAQSFTGEELKAQRCSAYNNVSLSDPSTADDGMMGKQQHWDGRRDHKQTRQPLRCAFHMSKGWMICTLVTHHVLTTWDFLLLSVINIFMYFCLVCSGSSWRIGLSCGSLASHLIPITHRSPSMERF